MKYWFKNVADNIYIYPKSAPRNLILQTRTSDCNSAYCLDKQQRKILYKIDKYEDMLKFLNQKYEIENFGWKNIFRE